MSAIFDCRDESQLIEGLRAARQAIGKGELVVAPTDTVYGIAADAFSPAAVQRLLDAKGRGRQSPPPVLVPGIATLAALVTEIHPAVDRLVEAFWPGGLTIVMRAQPSLAWDLGETRGTVAVRQPDNRVVLELLRDTGPLAVSSANLTGLPPATSVVAAMEMLGSKASAYLDDGTSPGGVASTIVDATGLTGGGADDEDDEQPRLRILRDGAIPLARIQEVAGDVLVEGFAP